jgi:hypothetical protein
LTRRIKADIRFAALTTLTPSVSRKRARESEPSFKKDWSLKMNHWSLVITAVLVICIAPRAQAQNREARWR